MHYFYMNAGDEGNADLFASAEPSGAERLSALSFCILIFCSYLSGAGGSAGLCSSINSTAKTFPDKVVSHDNDIGL